MSETAVEQVEKREVLDPRTGEIVDLVKAEDTYLAEFLHWIRELEAQCREAKRPLSEELHRRMDLDASWSRTAGTIEIKGQPPGQVEYNAERLKANLTPLVEKGLISQAALEAAIDEPVELKVRKRGVTALKKLGKPEIDEAIRLSEEPADKARRITLKEIGAGA